MSEDKKPDLKVVHIGEKSNLSVHYSIEQMLENVSKEIKNPTCVPPIIPDKAVMIVLDTKEGKYNLRWWSSNMSVTEQLAMLEVHRQTLIDCILGRVREE